MDHSVNTSNALESSTTTNASFQSCHSVLNGEVEGNEPGAMATSSLDDQKIVSSVNDASNILNSQLNEKNYFEQSSEEKNIDEQRKDTASPGEKVSVEVLMSSGEGQLQEKGENGSDKGESKSSLENKTQLNMCTLEESLEESVGVDPIKPPRRKRTNAVNTETKGSEETQHTSSDVAENPAVSPVKKRQLPLTPNADEKQSKDAAKSAEGNLNNITIVSVENIDDKLHDIVCNPVMTSSPVNCSTSSHTPNSSRIISFITSTSPDEVKQVGSFYDYLNNHPETNREGEREKQKDGIYDSVCQVSPGNRTDDRYDEVEGVIVNQEAYMMPAADDSDEWTDEDPWGSDFETDDDDTKSRVTEEEPYDSVEVLPLSQRRRPFKFAADPAGNTPEVKQTKLQRLREAISGSMPGSPKSIPSSIQGLHGSLQSCFTAGMKKVDSLPYMPNKRKVSEPKNEEDSLYVEPNIAETQQYFQPVMPPMEEGLSKQQAKRYQITKFFLESESDYMQLLDTLIKRYELPIRDRDLLEPSKIDVIFEQVHRVLDCHVMFSIALSDRMAEWNPQDKIGDILYALFQKSMVLEAYSDYVNNFTKAMDTVRTACRTHLAFSQFLKIRRQSCREQFSLHSLMLKPIQRFPQLVALIQELLLVTPRDHPDRVPLQLALTKLECLAENLNDRKREAELRNKVKLLDNSTAQLHKPLSTGTRYFIRQDDLVQCIVEGESIIRTKKRRLIMLSDMLLCLSWVKGKKDRMTHLIADPRVKYKLKWNVPLTDVEIVEYGPGVNVTGSAHRTTISYSKEGQYRKGYTGCIEHFEDLQHDLAVVGQIAGLVATLRRSYQVLDNERVQQWHRAVQRTIEEETRLANIYWLELSLPSKNGRVHYIFSADSPTTKAEWVTALNTAKLRLAPKNNPGWYLPEDDGTGAIAVQRRNMPLLKDKSDVFLLNQKAKVECIVSCPDVADSLPGIHDNYNLLWLLCSCGNHVGQISIVKISSSSTPQVVESFHVSDSCILCGVFVGPTCGERNKINGPFTGRFGFPFPTVWLGTQQGRIYIYNTLDSDRRYVMSVKLPDAVLVIRVVEMKVFAGLANGNVVVFKHNKDFVWNFSQPVAISLNEHPVTCAAVIGDCIWFGCGNKIFSMNCQAEVVEHVIEVTDNPKANVRNLVGYGVGVWVSINKEPTVKLYHSETFEHVQDISVALPVSKMQNDIDSQIEKTKLDKLYVTTMAAADGLLWVGTSVGIILVFSLPRLEGIPLASGQPCVSFHAFRGRVRCLFPLRDNPEKGLEFIRAQSQKPAFKLFRDFETRDACVQTDVCISGTRDKESSVTSRWKGKPSDSTAKSDVMYAEEDEDLIDSDEDFCFIEDQPGFKRMDKQKAESQMSQITEEEQENEEKIDKEEEPTWNIDQSKIKVDEFARLLSEFKGFSNSVAKPGALPERPQAVGLAGVEWTGHESSQATTTEESRVSGKEEKALGKHEDITESARQEVNQDDSQAHVKSKDECSNLEEEDVAKKPLTISRVQDSRTVGNTSVSPHYDQPEEGNQRNISTNEALGVTPPEYLQVMHNGDTLKPQDSGDPDQESIPKSDSFSVFDETRSEAFTATESQKMDPPVKKLQNLKPKLPFPLLVVSAGEGHVDIRKKRKGDDGLEPRLLVWQMN